MYMEETFEKLKRRISDQVRRFMKRKEDSNVEIDNYDVAMLRALEKRSEEKLSLSDRY